FYIVSFFLSSRRRHTSFSRDWSSDVCSSDLLKQGLSATTTPVYPIAEHVPVLPCERRFSALLPTDSILFRRQLLTPVRVIKNFRSEERRVGKESKLGLGTL